MRRHAVLRDWCWGLIRGYRLDGPCSSDRLRGSCIVSRGSEKRRRMPPDLQQERIGPDSRNERRHTCADEDAPGRRQACLHQQAHRPAGCRPQQGCSVANAHEGFKQVRFPQESIRKRPEDTLIPARPEWTERAKSRDGTVLVPKTHPPVVNRYRQPVNPLLR